MDQYRRWPRPEDALGVRRADGAFVPLERTPIDIARRALRDVVEAVTDRRLTLTYGERSQEIRDLLQAEQVRIMAVIAEYEAEAQAQMVTRRN